MSNHLVNDRFWDDSYIQDLNQEQKLLFLYFLSCPLNKYSGIFEISISMISFHTSVDKKNVEKYLEHFSKTGRAFYVDGWLCINNYNKYNKTNPNIEKNIKEQIKLIPESVLKEFERLKEEFNNPLLRVNKALAKPAINSNNIVSNNIVYNNNDNYIDIKKLTPSEIAKDFFNNINSPIRQFYCDSLKKAGLENEFIKTELRKFVSYWTEPTKSGKKQRWETEKTFEVGRRIYKWISNNKEFNRKNITITNLGQIL